MKSKFVSKYRDVGICKTEEIDCGLKLMWMTIKEREIARKSLNTYIGKNV